MYDACICYVPSIFQGEVAKRIYGELLRYRLPKKLDTSNLQGCKNIYLCSEAEMHQKHLSEATKRRLADSRCIIIICTAETGSNPLINQIIDYFISLGRWQQIIPVLTEGVPSQSFPPGLFQQRITMLSDEDGLMREYSETIEPLAADIRSPKKNKCIKNVSHATHKIIAAIIGCSYDNLIQRALKRKRKQQTIFLSASFALIICVLSIITTMWLVAKSEADRAVLQTRKAAAMLEDMYSQVPERFVSNQNAIDCINNLLLNSVDNLLIKKPASLGILNLDGVLELKDYDTVNTATRKASLLRQLGKTEAAMSIYTSVGDWISNSDYKNESSRYLDTARKFNSLGSIGYGYYILKINENASAETGLNQGDVIVGLNGKTFTGYSDFTEAFDNLSGDSFKLTVSRMDSEGKIITLEINVKSFPDTECIGI